MDFDIVFQFQTSLDSHRLARPFKGLSHEGWVEEPEVTHGVPNVVIFDKASFFFAGREVEDYPDDFATKRLFHVSSVNSISCSNFSSGVNPSVAVAFCYDFTPDNDNFGRDSARVVVVSTDELVDWNDKGFILGRLSFKIDPTGKVIWYFYTDCVDFADKYFVDKGLTGYRVAPLPLKSGMSGFNPNVFVIKHYNLVINSIPLVLQRFPDGVSVPVELRSAAGVDLSTIPSDAGGVHPRDNWFYALGYKSSVADGVDNAGGGSYHVDFSVLGYGETLEEAVEKSVDPETGLPCHPMAVVKWSPVHSTITQLEVSPSVSSTVNRSIIIDTESEFSNGFKGKVKTGLGDLSLQVPVRVDTVGGGLSVGLHSLHSVVKNVIKSLNSLALSADNTQNTVAENTFPYHYFGDEKIVDLNDYKNPGFYVFANPAEESTDFPSGWGFGEENGVILEVVPLFQEESVRQVICSRSKHVTLERFCNWGESWSLWRIPGGRDILNINYFGKELPDGFSWNLDTFFSAGVYVLHPVENQNVFNNWPSNWSDSEEEDGVGILEVIPFGSGEGASVRQILHPMSSANVWVRTLMGDGSFSMWALMSGQIVPPGFDILENVVSVPLVGQQLRYVLAQGSLMFGAIGHSYRGSVGGQVVDFTDMLNVTASYTPGYYASYTGWNGYPVCKIHSEWNSADVHWHPEVWSPITIQLLRYA